MFSPAIAAMTQADIDARVNGIAQAFTPTAAPTFGSRVAAFMKVQAPTDPAQVRYESLSKVVFDGKVDVARYVRSVNPGQGYVKPLAKAKAPIAAGSA